MTPQTRWHKHWIVRVREGSWVYRVLKIELVVSRNRDYVERSRLLWGEPDTREQRYILTVLGLLHTVTGVVVQTGKPTLWPRLVARMGCVWNGHGYEIYHDEASGAHSLVRCGRCPKEW